MKLLNMVLSNRNLFHMTPFDTFGTETFEPDTLDITFLRRGVIGVSKVGYVL